MDFHNGRARTLEAHTWNATQKLIRIRLRTTRATLAQPSTHHRQLNASTHQPKQSSQPTMISVCTRPNQRITTKCVWTVWSEKRQDQSAAWYSPHRQHTYSRTHTHTHKQRDEHTVYALALRCETVPAAVGWHRTKIPNNEASRARVCVCAVCAGHISMSRNEAKRAQLFRWPNRTTKKRWNEEA